MNWFATGIVIMALIVGAAVYKSGADRAEFCKSRGWKYTTIRGDIVCVDNQNRLYFPGENP